MLGIISFLQIHEWDATIQWAGTNETGEHLILVHCRMGGTSLHAINKELQALALAWALLLLVQSMHNLNSI
jgi:hypothetical protein